MRARVSLSVGFAGAGVLAATPAAAHGFGARYDLPLPLGLYLYGAAAVVALSFVVMAIFGRRPGESASSRRVPEITLLRSESMAAMLLAPAIVLLRAASCALFLLIVVAGFIGNQDPFRNLAPVSVWVLGWVGLAFASALVGNLWIVLNPWDNLFRLAQAATGRTGTPARDLPDRVGAWPAVGLFLVFAWLELVWPARDLPFNIASALAAYSLITWTGMATFGRRAWLARGEVFAVAFGLLARFAPLDIRDTERGLAVWLRPYGAGLLVREPVPPSLAALALLVLATVSFDGLIETPFWAAIVEAAFASEAYLAFAAHARIDPYLLLTTLALIVFPLILGGCFLAITTLMALLVRDGPGAASGVELTCLFALTVVPIAIGYHVAHYLSYLLISGQFIIPIASDPFGWGWNLFGTRLYLIDIGIVDARFVWYASVILIVTGHVIAVGLAHLEAERRFAHRRQVLISQGPMLAVMVGYTALSLWILAQPIVETGA